MSQFISVGNVLRKAKGVSDKDLGDIQSIFAQLPNAANFTPSDFQRSKEVMGVLKQVEKTGKLTDKQTSQLGTMMKDLRAITASAEQYRDAPTVTTRGKTHPRWRLTKDALGIDPSLEGEERRKLFEGLPPGKLHKIKDRSLREQLQAIGEGKKVEIEGGDIKEPTSPTKDVGTKLRKVREGKGIPPTGEASKEAMASQGGEGVEKWWGRWLDPLGILEKPSRSVSQYTIPPRTLTGKEISGKSAVQRIKEGEDMSPQHRRNIVKMKESQDFPTDVYSLLTEPTTTTIDTREFQRTLQDMYGKKGKTSKGLYIPVDRELRKAEPVEDRLKTIQNYFKTNKVGDYKPLMAIEKYLSRHEGEIPKAQYASLLETLAPRLEQLEGKMKGQISPSQKPTPPFLKTDADSTGIEAAHKTFSTWAKDKGLATISKDGKLVPTGGKEKSIIDKYLASGEAILPAFRDYLTKQRKPSKVTEAMGYRPGMSIFNRSSTQVADSWGRSSAGRKANIKPRSINVREKRVSTPSPRTAFAELEAAEQPREPEPDVEAQLGGKVKPSRVALSGKAPQARRTSSRQRATRVPLFTPHAIAARTPAKIRDEREPTAVATPTQKPTTLARSIFVSVDQSLKKACDIKGAIDHLLADWKERSPDTVAGRYYHDLKETAHKHGMSKSYQIWAETEALMKAEMGPEALALMKDTEITGYLSRWFPKETIAKFKGQGDWTPEGRAKLYQSHAKKLEAGKAGGFATKYKEGEGTGPLLASQLGKKATEGTPPTSKTSAQRTRPPEGFNFAYLPYDKFKQSFPNIDEKTYKQLGKQRQELKDWRTAGKTGFPPGMERRPAGPTNPMNVQLAEMKSQRGSPKLAIPSTRSATTTTEQPPPKTTGQ